VTISDNSEPAIYEGYTRVTGNVTITCPNCVSLEELGCLWSIGGDLSISQNNSLEALDLGLLDHVGGSLYYYRNPLVTTLDLARLRGVGSWLTIRGNDALQAITAGRLLAIGGDVSIDENDALDTIDLGGAQTITGDLTIGGNPALPDLDGLAALIFLGGSLDVTHNDDLPYCEVCELLDQLVGFAGEVICSSNLVDECWNGDAEALECPLPSGDGAILGDEP
jgi:hypothetical protein